MADDLEGGRFRGGADGYCPWRSLVTLISWCQMLLRCRRRQPHASSTVNLIRATRRRWRLDSFPNGYRLPVQNPPVAASPARPETLDQAAAAVGETVSVDGLGDSRPGDRVWMLLTTFTVLAAGFIVLWWGPRYYFHGDTQIGAFGQWYGLGELLRAGQWPELSLTTWRAGNYISEGQWGLFSPLTMLIALASTVVSDAVVFVTVVKLGLLVVAGLGTFRLVRSYQAPPPAAFVCGVAVTLGGATQYLESPSWVTGLMVWALLPVAWSALRRTALDRRSPALALVASYLIVTVGYVYGTLYLAIVIVATMVDAGLARDRRGVVRVFCVGVIAALVAVTVYLPGLLTASVTTRSQTAIVSAGRLQGDLAGLLTSFVPTGLSISSLTYPAHFIARFVPALLWIDFRRARRMIRPMVGLIGVTIFAIGWVLGPNQIGPLRWPLRVMPLVVLTILVLGIVIFSRCARRPNRGHLLASTIWTLAAVYLLVARFWTDRAMTLTGGAFVVGALVLTWFLLRMVLPGPCTVAIPPTVTTHLASPTRISRNGPRRHGPSLVAGLVVALCLGGVVLQHHFLPAPASVDSNMPSSVGEYERPASASKGDVMVVGDPSRLVIENPDVAREFLVASSWLVSSRPVQSIYSTIGFARYNDRYCIRYNGTTCDKALKTLFETMPGTDVRRVDLLSISTLLIVRKDFGAERLSSPPSGWTVADEGTHSVTWVREQPVPSAGGVVTTSAGTEVSVLSSTPTEARIRIDAVPDSGGQVVFSRLAWPGYEVHSNGVVGSARLGDPTDGYLVTAGVDASAVGSEVVVRFRPPGWAIERATLLMALLLGTVWAVAFASFARRRSQDIEDAAGVHEARETPWQPQDSMARKPNAEG